MKRFSWRWWSRDNNSADETVLAGSATSGKGKGGPLKGAAGKGSLEARWAAWIRAGVIASEMECASLFTVAAVRGIRAGAAVLVVNETPVRAAGMPEATSLPLQPLIDTGVGAVRRLIASDARPAPSPSSSG